MYFNENERTAIFIDGINFSGTLRQLDMKVDYKRLLDFFRGRTRLIRATYYTYYLDLDQQPLRTLLDWLQYNGYHVVAKPVPDVEDSSRRSPGGDARIDMAVDAVDFADVLDHVVLFTGHAGFRRPIEILKRRGKRVTVVSSIRTNPSALSDELRRRADQMIDLVDLERFITRERPRE